MRLLTVHTVYTDGMLQMIPLVACLRYEVGQEYQPHYDYFFDLDSVAEFGQRVATVIMYLSDDYQGKYTSVARACARLWLGLLVTGSIPS